LHQTVVPLKHTATGNYVRFSRIPVFNNL
jgi:hypothetical protein